MRSPRLTTHTEINLKHFALNLRLVFARLNPGAGILLVVKSDAYGHGMIPVARAASRFSFLKYFGVSTAQEAFELRAAGIRRPILLLAPAHPSDAAGLIRRDITLAVSSFGEARILERQAAKLRKKVRVHAELDTGMGRLGVRYTEGLHLLFGLMSLRRVVLEGAFSHFPNAGSDAAFSADQIDVFSKIIELFRELYPKALRWVHLANSSGVVCHPESHFNLVRPGLAVYGVRPDGGARLPVRPVLSWKTKVSIIRRVPAHAPISYGSLYRTRQATHIATCPIGYSYGYPIRLTGHARVRIGGRFYPVVGRITMDHLMVDLGPKTSVRAWDEVILIGGSGAHRISAEELARRAGTIPYEILCGIHPKVRRLFIK